MDIYRFNKILSLFLALLFVASADISAQNRDQLPAEFREYTNPEEVVQFDRTTSFSRALDVINEFAQKYRGKIVINRSNAEGEVGISVPPMHWMDALKLILRVKSLVLIEKQDFYEVVTAESLEQETSGSAASAGSGAGANGEKPIATTKTHEVRINAIFFEGNRRALQEIGVDWSTISENVPETILQSGGSGGGGGGGGGQGGGQQGPQLPNRDFTDGPFVQVNSKGAQNVSQDVFNALINIGEIGNTGIEVQTLFSAFEADNLGEILASPTIKVMDGQDGRIQVGQDFSIKRRDIAGNVIEDFFSVGTILEVTPQVIEQNDTTFIHLDIAAERSTAQPDPVSTIINKQQATTQALLLDGEATVIAGLYNTEKAEVRRGIPILKDLPAWFFGLKYLFGYSSEDYQMRELVILLQATLEPSIPQRFAKDETQQNKFEVLQDERQRMRKEIKSAEELMGVSNDLDEESYDEEEAIVQSSETSDELAEQKPAKEQANEMQAEEDNSSNQAVNTRNEEKEEEPSISDPEVKTKKIRLDLGSSKDEAENATEQTEDREAKSEQSQRPKASSGGAAMYYLIGGSFKVEKNAIDLRNELLDEGFDAEIIKMEGTDIKLVAYQGFKNLKSARSGLAQIKQYQNADAWLYKLK